MTKNGSFANTTDILLKNLGQNHYLNKIWDVHPLYTHPYIIGGEGNQGTQFYREAGYLDWSCSREE